MMFVLLSHFGRRDHPNSQIEFGYIHGDEKSIMYANMGSLRSLDCESRNQNPGENDHFCTDNLLIRLKY